MGEEILTRRPQDGRETVVGVKLGVWEQPLKRKHVTLEELEKCQPDQSSGW